MSATKLWCETCEGLGTVDETLGGEHFSNPKAECPDCEGHGYWVPVVAGDGGPAFPVSTSKPTEGHQDSANTWQYPGMPLRDYLAAHALPGVLSTSWPDLNFKPVSGLSTIENTAVLAYEIADAMLKVRSS